eukprot:9530200-Prorocentrum_lima.AAC.1
MGLRRIRVSTKPWQLIWACGRRINRCHPYDASVPTISAQEAAKPGNDGTRRMATGGSQHGSITCMA